MVEKQKENDGLYLRFIEFAMGIGIGHSKEVINHHAPQTPHANANSALKESAIDWLIQKQSKELQKARLCPLQGYLAGKGR